MTRKVEDWQNDIMPKQTTHLTLFIFRRITHRYRNQARCKKRILFGLVSDHPARNTNAGCGPDLFRRRRVGSSFVQSKRIRHNASISEPGQMYKNGSDSDRSMTIRPGIEIPDVVSICFFRGGSDLASFSPGGSGITHRYRNRARCTKTDPFRIGQ